VLPATVGVFHQLQRQDQSDADICSTANWHLLAHNCRGCLPQQAHPFSLRSHQSLCVGQGKTAVLLKCRKTRHFNCIIPAQRNKTIIGLGSRTEDCQSENNYRAHDIPCIMIFIIDAICLCSSNANGLFVHHQAWHKMQQRLAYIFSKLPVLLSSFFQPCSCGQ
jgi:hypothetical protein